ncbi:hypothetical protein N431DRAFT_550667 [Stipitochalara longipes BDJ]|nr:hypothetical protein N431DRAFT_550667 [Stipitochalara longipes BDJ]
MQLSQLYGVCVFVFSLLVYPTIASECQLGDLSGNNSFIVSSPEELSAAIPPTCTVIVGEITIAQNYTGPFVLNGITNFTGLIQAYSPNITAFEMEDLLYMGLPPNTGLYFAGIALQSVPTLTSMYIPKATYIDQIQIGDFSQASFDFSGLVNATNIRITGDSILSILLPSLASVAYGLQIYSSNAPRVDIDLPALTTASSITIYANLSRVSMPLLSLLDDGELSSYDAQFYDVAGGLSINNLDNSGSTIAMIFPQLQATNVTSFSGAIESVMLPSLIETQGNIYVVASKPLAVNLTNLESVHDIYLNGNISSFNFPDLTYFNGINIASELPINCTPAYTAYDRAWRLHGNGDANITYTSYVSCYSRAPWRLPPTTKKSGGHRLSTSAKIDIALGVGLPVLSAIALLWFWFLQRKAKNDSKDLNGESARVELCERDLPDLPPEYDSVMATEVGSLRSERTAVQPDEGENSAVRDLEHVHGETDNYGDVSPVTPVTPVERNVT